MKLSRANKHRRNFVPMCYGYRKEGYFARSCPTLYCTHCKIKGHSLDKCKKIGDSIKRVQSDDEHNYAFRADKYSNDQGLLVNTGASSHIIRDLRKFTDLCDKYKDAEHTIELGDGSQSQATKQRGIAIVNIIAKDGQTCSATLKNALYVPDYPSDIFSVISAIDNGATISFFPQ